MKKRVGFAYVASIVLAAVAFAILMLKLIGPETRWAAGSVYALSWVLFVYAVRRHQRVLGSVRSGARRLKSVWATWYQELIAVLALVTFGALGLILMPADDAPFLMVRSEQIRQLVRADLARVERAAQGAERQAVTLLDLLGTSEPTSLDSTAQLRAAWASYLDYAIELDQLIELHKHFYQINPVKLNEERADSFLIAFLALSQQLKSGFEIRSAVKDDPRWKTVFDEASPEHGYDANTYYALTQGLTQADNLVRLQAGFAYYGLLTGQNHYRGEAQQRLSLLARERALSAFKLFGKNADALLDNPLTYLESKAFAAWFPLQRKVASGLGDIRVQHRPNFVSLENLRELKKRLQPMDVLLERRNWYATNVGLPGFWPHAALYVGEPARLDEAFDSALVKSKTGHESLSAFLAEERRETWHAFQRIDDEGAKMSVLEAISDGVVFQSFEHSGQADYLAVLRPNLEEEDRFDALLRALSHHQKPYDFDFDFVTDNSLVCSELVYKSLEGIGGIHFELETNSGRQLLTPNQIARKFDREFDAGRRSLDFIAFLDGSEEEKCAFERDATALRHSWRRPKWDIVQP